MPQQVGELIVLVGLDTTSSERCRAFEPSLPAAQDGCPHLTALARESTVWSQAWATSPWTLPSFASVLTGRSPGGHGAGRRTPHASYAALAEDQHTVTERLGALGFATRAWVNNPYLEPRFGLDQGFDIHQRLQVGARGGATEDAVPEALAWLGQGGDRFAFVHFMEPHGPYRPTRDAIASVERDFETLPDRFRRGMPEGLMNQMLRRQWIPDESERRAVELLHIAAMRDADGLIGHLVEGLRALPAERVRLVLVGDHGEEFWEHGGLEHGHDVNDTVMRVPLLAWPGEGERIDEPVSIQRVAAMLLEGTAAAGAAPVEPPVLGGGAVYGPDRWFARSGDAALILRTSDRSPGSRAPGLAPAGGVLSIGEGVLEGPDSSRLGAERDALLDLLLPELLGSLAGARVIALRPGSAERAPLAGRVVDPPPGPVISFAWPRGRLQAVTLERDRSGLAFSIPQEGGFIALLERGDQPLSIEWDGTDHGSLGTDLVDPQAFFAQTAGEHPAVLMGRVPGTPSSQLTPDEVERLRSLGYLP